MAAKKPQKRGAVAPKEKPKQRKKPESCAPDHGEEGIPSIPVATSFTPRMIQLTADDAMAVLNSQISQFHQQPDGTYVRDYSMFSTDKNKSLKIFIDAGMNLEEIAFHANIAGDKHIKINGLAEARTLADVAKLRVPGKPATVTLTKEQFEKLDGFYRAIAYPPRKAPSATPDASASRSV